MGESGAVLASLADTDFELAEARPKLRSLQVAGSFSPRDVLKNAFPQIEFLGPGDELGIALDNALSPVEEIVEIGSKAAPAIQQALTRMSKTALGAVRTVAVARLQSDSNTIGLTYGSTVVLSSLIDTEPLQMLHTTVHEATHSEYGPERIAGAVFFLKLRNAGGLITDNFPFGTFRVDNP